MLVLLIGPKGSGKSHIGRLLEAKLGIHFFDVEPHWMSYHAACAATGRPVRMAEGIEHVRPAIVDALATHEHVCVETTGASREILDDLLALGDRFGLLLVRVEVPLELCLDRIASRDQANQIPMQEDAIRHVHALSATVGLPYAITLENVGLTDEEVLRPFVGVGMGGA